MSGDDSANKIAMAPIVANEQWFIVRLPSGPEEDAPGPDGIKAEWAACRRPSTPRLPYVASRQPIQTCLARALYQGPLCAAWVRVS